MTDISQGFYVLEPKIFKSVESLCKLSLAYSDNHPEIRRAVANLCFHMQQLNPNLTPDIISIRNILRKSNPNFEHERPPVEQDPILVLRQGSNPKLNEDQEVAASNIRKIWRALSKFLNSSAKDYNTSTSKKNKVLLPLDVIDQKTYDMYRDIYIPWYTNASRNPILNYKKEPMKISEGDVVLSILIEMLSPYQCDYVRRIPKGSSLRALQRQLYLWHHPNANIA